MVWVRGRATVGLVLELGWGYS